MLKPYLRRAQDIQDPLGVNTPYPVALERFFQRQEPASPRFGGSRRKLPQLQKPGMYGVASKFVGLGIAAPKQLAQAVDHASASATTPPPVPFIKLDLAKVKKIELN